MTDLKPCPFCNGEAKMESTPGGQGVDFATVYRAQCSYCYRMDFPWNSYQSEAASEWNTRAALTAAGEGEADEYLIWSNEHGAWWRPNSAGYTTHLHAAGRYSAAEAKSISHDTRDGWRSPDIPPKEIAVPVSMIPSFPPPPTE